MILVESSAWIEFDRATGSAVHRRLAELIDEDGPVAVTEPILMEVLAGARLPQSVANLRRLLTSFNWIDSEAQTDFEGAAKIYRDCRAAGVTPRGLIDCMIASIAIRSNSELLTADADFARMTEIIPLRLVAVD